MSKLFNNYTIGKLEIKNRLAVPPMCMYSAKDGHASDFHTIHYGSMAIGGAGLIIVEATGVSPCGRITDNCLGAYEDSHIESLKRIADAIKSGGSVPAIQLNHAGRKCTADVPEIYAPSAIAFDSSYRVPIEMNQKGIQTTIDAFKSAAKRAGEAGFEMIEIHGAHGYLLSSYLSPLSNKRTDEYGGSHENRARIVGQVIKAVKEVFKGAICLRVSAKDFVDGGNNTSDVGTMINSIKNNGIDIVNVSSGAVAPVTSAIPIYPGYQVKLAEEIKSITGLPVMAGGLLTSPLQMEEIIANERADMVYVGRELLRNPHFPLLASNELKAKMPWPVQYERAKKS